MQFDDDRNELPLASHSAVDVLISRPLVGGLDVFLALENLFDQRAEVSATPVITYGQPRSIRLGVRYWK